MAVALNKTEIKDTKLKGKGLFATENVFPGTPLIQITEPFVALPESGVLDTVCSNCFLQSDKLHKCKGCSVVGYCDVACQRASWKRDHSKECKIFKRVYAERQTALPTPVRALINTIIQYEKHPEIQTHIQDLMGHQDKLMADSEDNKDLKLQAFGAMMYAGLPQSKLPSVAELLCRLKVNAFRLTLPDDTDIGICFDPSLARANHSCTPNAQISFNGRQASLMPLEPIPKGTEITISYIDPTETLLFRQFHLYKQFLFDCDCWKCSNRFNPYAVFIPHPCRDDNSTVLTLDPDQLMKTASKFQDLYEAEFDVHLLETLEPSLAEQSRQLGSTAEKYQFLKEKLESEEHLRLKGCIARDPIPSLVRELSSVYIEAQEWAAALLLRLTMVYNIDPFLYPEPWHPSRVTSLYALARLINVCRSNSEYDLTTIKAAPKEAVIRLDDLSVLYTLLCLILELSEKSHGKGSRFWQEVSEHLAEVEASIRDSGDHNRMVILEFPFRSERGRWNARNFWEPLAELAKFEVAYEVVQTVDLRGGGKWNAAGSSRS